MTTLSLTLALLLIVYAITIIHYHNKLKTAEAFIKTLLKEHGKEVNDPYGFKDRLLIDEHEFVLGSKSINEDGSVSREVIEVYPKK
jgi:hypothetical protein